jgi:hypothetical protein
MPRAKTDAISKLFRRELSHFNVKAVVKLRQMARSEEKKPVTEFFFSSSWSSFF